MASNKRTSIPPARLAACEPCREAKVACDHLQPICSRCQERDVPDRCVYRARPFKRRKNTTNAFNNNSSVNIQPSVSLASQSPSSLASQSPSAPNTDVSNPSPHPNPGYLGSSSYLTIFEHMTSNGTKHDQTESLDITQSTPKDGQALPSRVSEAIVAQGARLLEEIKSSAMFPSCAMLMERWFARGSNIALASQFSRQCVESTSNLIQGLQKFSSMDVSRNLSQSSNSPLNTDDDIDAFISSFCASNTRWETLSLCFLMFPRATFYVDTVEHLYKSIDERQAVRKKAIAFSDQCLEIALSLDCLNDLQLFVQYENFIAHSYVDGDQSYNSWRKLGDVASSLYALGYHDDVAGRPVAPEWLQELRKSAVARSYSADKNVAIFLGRPPRIHHKFFSTKVLGIIALDIPDEVSKELWQLQALDYPTFCYDVDTWWSAMCARLKEEALDLSREASREEQARKARIIEAHAKAQWEALPPRYYLTGSIKAYSTIPQERDFVVGAKLNHLHVLFITEIAQTRFVPEPSHKLVSISTTMLSLVTEAIVLRTYLSNSGTTLMWKLIYYGLPAAGIVCLYLLDRSLANNINNPTTNSSDRSTAQQAPIPRTKALQDLNVLVAQIESRAFTDTEDPNFDLLSSAATTMQAIIEKLLSGSYYYQETKPMPSHATHTALSQQHQHQHQQQPELETQQRQGQGHDNGNGNGNGTGNGNELELDLGGTGTTAAMDEQQWLAWNNGVGGFFQDFETEFWVNLADHPALGGG